jgi:hypothetical protein
MCLDVRASFPTVLGWFSPLTMPPRL